MKIGSSPPLYRLAAIAPLVLAMGASVHAAGKPRFSFWKPAGVSQPTTVHRPQPTAAAVAADAEAQKNSGSEAATEEQTQTELNAPGSGTVKLNYYGATWGTVLRDVAKKTGSQLVGNRIPAGRFTRRDNKTYTRSEAVRIINKEIESKGFRVLEQDQMLIVLDIPSIRPRYQPAVIKSSLERLQESSEADAVGEPSESEPVDENPLPRRQPDPRSRAVRSAKHEVIDDETASPSDFDEQEQAPKSVVMFRSRNRPVLEIAREIYRAYPDHRELISTGERGLPGFRIRQVGESREQGVQFDVTVDQANDEARIEVAKNMSPSVMKLFRRLDVPASESGTMQLLAESPNVCRIAAQLVPIIEGMRQDRATRQRPDRRIAQVDEKEDGPAEDVAQLDDAEEPQTEVERVPPKGDVEMGEEEMPPSLTDVVGNLKGEVRIESFEDLGALVIIGAEADVEQVIDVIRQLEKLSEATAPQVHLLLLNFVDSSALAELMTMVYERLTRFPGKATQPRQSVAILPVGKPNAILIIAPKADMESIQDLADKLDQPVDPLTEFQVFPLKSAIASQVETLLTEFYAERPALDTRILIRADARTNSVIIRARPRDLEEAAALIKKLDREASAAVSQVQIFPLKNAAAAELAAILNQAIQSVLSPPTATPTTGGGPGAGAIGGGAGQVAEQFRDVRSTVLQFLAVDAEGERKLRSGLLADIRITPDPRMNALLVAAPERSMLLMAELIRQLDRPAAAVAEIKVFPLTNADATRVVQQLQNLFAPTGQQGGFNNQQRQALGIQVLGAEDAGSALIPLRFSVDTRTNSIIAIGGAEALGVVEAILYRLDEGDIRERQQIVYRLKNSPATNIADAITQFLTSQQELSRADPNLISTVEQLEREVIVVPEPVSNSLLISATPRYYSDIVRLVKKLDEPPAQVVIQALLVEVTLDNTDEFGIELGFQNSLMFNRSVKDPPTTISQTTTQPNGNQTTTQDIIAQTATPGFNFQNPALPLGNNVAASPSQMALQSLSNFSMSRVNGDLGFGGLVLSAGSDTVNVLIRALSQSRRLQVLSRPQIRTLDNQTGQVLQGQIVPVVNGVTISGTGLANPIVQLQEAGIILTVTPRISPDGQIVMDLIAEKSAYQLDGGVPIFTDAANGNVITAPVKDIATARAVVSVPNGQTVVIGGLISSSDERLTRKVPWLGDIPVLGYAFRYDGRTTLRRELLIFLTPRLVREDVDSELIKDIEIARMHFIESDAEEIHGPLRGIPAEVLGTDGEAPWIEPDGAFFQPTPTVPAIPAPEMQPLLSPPPAGPPAPLPDGEEAEEVPPPALDEPVLPMPDASPPIDSLLPSRHGRSQVLQATYEETVDAGVSNSKPQAKRKLPVWWKPAKSTAR